MKRNFIVFSCLLILLNVTGCQSVEKKPKITHRDNAILLKMANPSYPKTLNGKRPHGYVQMRFDVNEFGQPINIEVVKSVPKAVFDKAAIDALSRWQYAPKIINSIPVIATGYSVQLDFKVS